MQTQRTTFQAWSLEHGAYTRLRARRQKRPSWRRLESTLPFFRIPSSLTFRLETGRSSTKTTTPPLQSGRRKRARNLLFPHDPCQLLPGLECVCLGRGGERGEECAPLDGFQTTVRRWNLFLSFAPNSRGSPPAVQRSTFVFRQRRTRPSSSSKTTCGEGGLETCRTRLSS